VATNLRANPRILLTADENWPEGAPLTVIAHSYVGVLGWHAPLLPMAD
jgi:hypothetical protein